MSTATCTPTKVGPVFPHDARIRNAVGGVAINGGSAIYFDVNGVAQIANSADVTHEQFAGVALPRLSSGYACGAGQACEYISHGEVEGYDLSAFAYGSLVYLQDDGTFGSAAGTKSVVIGRVEPTTDKDGNGAYRKVLYVFANPTLALA